MTLEKFATERYPQVRIDCGRLAHAQVVCAAKMLNKYILKPAGLPNDRHLKFHAIRKTVGTIVAAERGEEVARKALGHSSVSVTRRYIANGASVSPNLPQEFSPVDVMPKIG